jgi:hypothetical protein
MYVRTQKFILLFFALFGSSQAAKACNVSAVRDYCEGLPIVPTDAHGLPTQGKFTWHPGCANAKVGSKCNATCDQHYKQNKGSNEVSCVVLAEGAEPQWGFPDLDCTYEPLGIYANWCTAITTIVTFIVWTLIGKCMYDTRKQEHAAVIATGVPKRDPDDM